MKIDINIEKYIIENLESTIVATISTCKENKPWCATIYYAYDKDFNLYFFSHKNTRHSREGVGKDIALAIVNPESKVGYVRGLQMIGSLKECNLTELPNALNIYIKRFSDAIKYTENIKQLVDVALTRRLYKVKILTIKLFDNKMQKDLGEIEKTIDLD